jgi:hypothetical protein
MKLKNHPFFKKYRYLKYALLLHLFFSVLIFISVLVRGYIYQYPLLGLKKPFENYKALTNPKKYLKSDFFVVDTAYTEESSDKSYENPAITTFIKGHLLHSTIKKEIICQYENSAVLYDKIYDPEIEIYMPVDSKKGKVLKVWRNTLNDDVFLEDKKHLSDQKGNDVFHIYIYFSVIVLIAVLLILKKKSEIKNKFEITSKKHRE